ncbi:MAG: hypothetical protein MUF45_01995 [Spirosomaceae bacterium]|jgi:hypothetical protein|nr:hypothetical protein [Spirosomataceae bacterium]
MQQIDKNYDKILSTKYKAWVDNLELKKKKHPESRTYYDDVVMDLYRCQKGVCAYTEMFICISSLYDESNWVDGEYKIPDEAAFQRTDHLGELEHFNPDLKENHYWLWDNFFMIHSTVNSLKSNKPVANFLKPDLPDYSPHKYFDYDESTHRFIPNTDIEDENLKIEIKRMIDEVLFLNHGVVRNERENYINDIKQKIRFGSLYKIDRFFTAVDWCIG